MLILGLPLNIFHGHFCMNWSAKLYESCVWRAVSSHSSHHPEDVLQAQFSLYVHKAQKWPKAWFFSFFSMATFVWIGHLSFKSKQIHPFGFSGEIVVYIIVEKPQSIKMLKKVTESSDIQ